VTLADALRLGRISNLPTVWTNAAAGMVLAGGWLAPPLLALLLLSASAAYVGGMFLNDAFDAEIDRRQRPERPIPSGRTDRRTVFLCGGLMLLASVAGLAIVGASSAGAVRPALAGIVLAGLVVAYDWHHKQNPLGPLLMGLCRVMVYVAAGYCVTASPPAALWIGAALLLCHVIGLTYVAKQETLARIDTVWPLFFLAAPLAWGIWIVAEAPVAAIFWLVLAAAVVVSVRFVARRGPGDVPRAVMTLIAAISALDALLIAGQGRLGIAFAALAGGALTLALQRFVRGT
jgi:hypothetical protein